MLKKIPKIFCLAVFSSSFLIGCSSIDEKGPQPSLFQTREAAENAAKSFGCVGAHKMGDLWMPCKSHQEKEKQDGHGHHHH